MADIKCEKREGILIVTMMRGKANALNLAMVERLNAAVDEASREEAISGVVLASGCPRFFSGGFDAKEVFEYDRETMTLFFSRFMDLCESLSLLPKPTVASVPGHAFGAGAILAVSCDFRILAKGGFGFAFSEINLGLMLPPGVVRMAIGAVGFSQARAMVLSGEPLTPARALEIGLAHSLSEPEAVLERAVALCRSLARKPASAYAAVKQSFRGLAGHPAAGDYEHFLDSFIEQWFSQEAQCQRQALLASLTGRTAGPAG